MNDYTTKGTPYLIKQKQLFRDRSHLYTHTSNFDQLMTAHNYGFVFHGSDKQLKTLNVNHSHLSKDNVVFAGRLWFALAFIPKWDDSMVDVGVVNGRPRIVGLTRRVEDIFSVEGYIHLVSPMDFFHTPKLMNCEFISTKDTEVIHSTRIVNVLSSLERLGVLIYNK